MPPGRIPKIPLQVLPLEDLDEPEVLLLGFEELVPEDVELVVFLLHAVLQASELLMR